MIISSRDNTNQNANLTDGADETALLVGGKMDGPCFGCARGKMTRRRRTKQRTRCATRCLERIHSDVIGSLPEGVHGYKYVRRVVATQDDLINSANALEAFLKTEFEALIGTFQFQKEILPLHQRILQLW